MSITTPFAAPATAPAGTVSPTGEPVLLAGTANPVLAAAVAQALGRRLGRCTVERFPDGEVAVELQESVRGREVVLLQPTAPPVNDHLVELLALADACRRAAAARVTAVVPYFGYARGDKRQARRVPVMARLAADLVERAGVDHLLTVDVHTQQLEGFFHIPVDVLSAVPLLCDAVRALLPAGTVVVSPDLGAVRLATAYGQRLALPVAVCRKRRLDGATVEVAQLIGDVRDRPCLVVDDMITTGGTMVRAVEALRAAGARGELFVAASHGVFAPGAVERLQALGVHDVVVTDSIPLAAASGQHGVRTVSVAALLAAAVRRLHAGQSLHDLATVAHAGGEP